MKSPAKILRQLKRLQVPVSSLPDAAATGSTGRRLAANDPLPVAEFVLNLNPNLRRWRGSWYLWRDGAYVALTPDQAFKVFLDAVHAYKAKTPFYNPREGITATVVNGVAAVATTKAGGNDDREQPFWIGDAPEGMEDPRDLLTFRNGVLNVESGQIIPPTSALFTTAVMGFDYGHKAARPRRFFRFLDEVFGDREGDEARLWQEFTGYCLTYDTRQKNILFIHGPTRSGKSTFARIVTRLAAPAGGLSLSDLGGEFGMASLVGLKVNVCGDVRQSGRDAGRMVERLLSITGNDAVSINRKYRDPLTTRLACRFIVLSNELPNFPDASGTIIDRLLILETKRSFLGKEDPNLENALDAELTGILHWALAGLRRLRDRGRFVEPASSGEVRRQLHEASSPVIAFVNESCRLGPRLSCRSDDLYRHYERWAERNGTRMPMTRVHFFRALKVAVSQVERVKQRNGDGRSWAYRGIALCPGK